MHTRRSFTLASLALATSAAVARGRAKAAGAPIRIGFSIAQSGGLAPGGRSGLLALQIWRDEINAKGGIIGRQVELVGYDDQTDAALVPALYAKLIDVDKVDILLSPYGTNVAGPAAAIAKARNRVLFGMVATGLNIEAKSSRYFSMGPYGPDPRLTHHAFFDLAHDNGFTRLAVLTTDAEFQQISADGARLLAKQYGMDIVFDQKYPPNTTDFSGLLASLQGTEPDFVYVCSYPTESAAIINGIGELGLPPTVQMFGGGLVGIQNASLLETLGDKLNGIVNYDFFSIEPNLLQPGAQSFLDAYAAKAGAAKVDPLGHYLPPFWYAAGQVIEAAVTATGGMDDKALADWLHTNEIKTIVGPIRFGPTGEWTDNRVFMVQYRGVKSRDIEQFRRPGKAVVVAPESVRTGELVKPFAQAQQ